MNNNLATNRRNGSSCCDDFRPQIIVVSNTSATVGQTIDAGSGADFTGSELDLNTITVNQLTADQINTSSITAFTMITTFMSDFTVADGDDVVFIGEIDSANDKFFWDSSKSTLFLDGEIKTREAFITLCAESNENALTIADADIDKGMLFKWYDDTVTTEKLGFFGFDDSTNRFTVVPDATNTSSVISGAFGDMEANTYYGENITNDDVGVDLNITSISNINTISTLQTSITALDGLFLESTDSSTDILVNGDATDKLTLENTLGAIEIISAGVTDSSILLQSDAGGIKIDNNSVSHSLDLESVNDIRLTTGTVLLTVDTTNGLESNTEKADFYHRIPYYRFEAFSGYWLNDSETITNSIYSWTKEPIAETAVIHVDVDLSTRLKASKGYRLQKIFFSYKIQTDVVTTLAVTVSKKEYDDVSPDGGLVVTNIPVTDDNLITAGKAVNANIQYRAVDITTPFFIDDESTLSIELSLTTPATTVFNFYSCSLLLDRNDL